MESQVSLRVLSGGAAQGLLGALGSEFTKRTGYRIDAAFGSAGATRAKLLTGEYADVVILTARLIDELTQQSQIIAGSAVNLGAVPTSLAVRAGDPPPPVGDAARLREALRNAGGIYFPDPKLATAGIHFAKVLDRLGVAGELAPRLRPFPNGATAMRAMAQATEDRPLGCTQLTEIVETPGVTAVAPLPGEFALSTIYTAAVAARATHPDAARQLVELLTAETTASLRQRLGFAPTGADA